ncbi:hypothetical protein [Methylobacterium sp. J-067]|uniref:hypothetical protein n=1 Tax=Methylobacterium sp. J-067 TaxID=2836648 RepID=UPI001FBBD92A|nr:hypothetical protein [Methylobacterium sp. J-067]MCJ2023377.1 hypothetical protein [Methylobacterium sp. J-067]
MAIHHPTPPIRGGERPRLPFAQRGPVTIALAAMQAADPDRQRIRELRRAIADRIEADIALLDALAGDTDFEFDDELEDENEHGGDVQDEPHDAQFDDEHAAQPVFMGRGAFHAGSFGRDA